MLNIFNSFTRKREILKINSDKMIKMYVCGATVYDFCHIGHGRTFIFFDVVSRYLRHCNYKLKYVRNITDVDDKIISRSVENNENISDLSNRMIYQMNQDFLKLNIDIPDYEPRVTENISCIIKFIANLLENKFAYISGNGDVKFSIDRFPSYGELSQRRVEQFNISKTAFKSNSERNPLDFVLWKLKAKDNKYSWTSPWGRGRPGWHIECSSMSTSILNDRIDIHGGGKDLLFPHHENELAQSTCINRKFQVHHWMHTELVIINNKKMSKSLGNALLLKDLLMNYDSESIRLFLLSTHYRHPLYFCESGLRRSEILLRKLYFSLRNVNLTLLDESGNSHFKLDFYKALDNDFNIPIALSILFRISREINILKSKYSFKNSKIIELAFLLRELGSILGILFHDPEFFFQKNDQPFSNEVKNINYFIQKRNSARRQKQWVKADKIRNYLLGLGIILEDSKNNTFWRKLR
ncbi:cysteine--tRNA ligase [Buchnera aphidicola (Schlechtendalia chinensis)]|uniref:Cysteine--tRNA ligase n=1 Tax=Buchnera aphidicola subsp. Schlechtendalia chinensis TaxID=118110 RepID=A0A172WE45_BUCSC|nr:cysteine--tRNA ligase [Buchnera aphidicola]ANF17195.1 cysteine--tRNA ligase [Buchnera aphidicola (Schlechtendalia chinensis)]